jgi:hypothetical protein
MIAANNPLSPKEHEAYCRKYGEDATKVYELILREPGTELPVAEIAQEIGKTNCTAMRATKKLVAHGLVTIQTTHGAARGARDIFNTCGSASFRRPPIQRFLARRVMCRV